MFLLPALLVVAAATGQNFGQELVSAANDPSKAERVRELVTEEPDRAAAVVRDLLRGAARAKDEGPPMQWAERITAAIPEPALRESLRAWLQRMRARHDKQRKAAIAYEQEMQRGVVALNQQKHQAAYDHAALAHSHSHTLTEPYLTARALSLRGIVAGKLERWHESITDLTESARAVATALAPLDARSDRYELARTREAAATFFSIRGRYEDALRHIESARTVWQALDDQPQLGRCLVMLGSSYGELARFADADAALQAATVIFAEPSAARGRVLLAMGLSQLDQGKDTGSLLEDAREMCRSASDTVGEAEACRHLGRALLKKAKPRLADAAYARALELPGSPLMHALAHTGRGEAAAMRDDDATASRHFERALAVGKDVAEGCWRAEVGLGAIAERAGESSKALSAYLRAIEHLENLRRMLRLPVLRARALTERREPYARAARLCAIDGNIDAAFELLERLHARTLWEAAAGPATTRKPSQALQELERELAAIEGAIESEPDPKGRETLRKQRSALRDQHAAERLRQKLHDPRYEALSHGRTASLAQVMANLDEDAALLTYLVTAEETWCIVTRLARSRAVVLPVGAARLQQQVDAVLEPVRALARGETDTSNLHFPARTAAELHTQLIAPLKLQNAKRLYVIADGPLVHLPFAMLVSQRERRAANPQVPYAQYHGCRYLIEDCELAMLPTAALLTIAPDDAPEGPALVVGHGLPGTRAEARAVAKVLGMDPATDDLDPAEAIVQQRLARCSRMHFATHAELDTARPAFARLQLAAGNGHDGWLHAFEIANLDLAAAPRVVLSGCNTAGHAQSSDGLLGLTRAFLVAGATSVVATHWPVADQASATLMADFHRQEGDSVTALAAVQRALLQGGRKDRSGWSHPYFWAGYAVHGPR